MNLSELNPIKEYLTRDNYIANCEEISGLTDIEKKAAKNALIYLKSIFGERFLQRIYNPQANQFPHPLGFYILNQVAYTRFYLTGYVEALRAVQGAKNFTSIFKRFKDTDKFAEGKSVLETALEFYHAGFEIEFDPEVFVTDQKGQSRQKFPDLRVISKKLGRPLLSKLRNLKKAKNG